MKRGVKSTVVAAGIRAQFVCLREVGEGVEDEVLVRGVGEHARRGLVHMLAQPCELGARATPEQIDVFVVDLPVQLVS